MVRDAGNAGLKVIFDHHDNDGGPGGWGGQQPNGLWIASGPGTNGTDGSGTSGTVTAAKFLANSVALAKHYAGNSTVIGFDLANEPASAGQINWGQGGPTDVHAMYTQVGNAMQAVDPGALIIAEGPEEWSGPAPGMPAGFGEGDLSGVASMPVALNIPSKVEEPCCVVWGDGVESWADRLVHRWGSAGRDAAQLGFHFRPGGFNRGEVGRGGRAGHP